MRQMTRPEFETYEKRIEAALSSMEQSLDESERASFEEVAAAAREVIGIRREHVELLERQHLDEAHRHGITPEYYMVADEDAARFGMQDAAIAHAAISGIGDVSQELQFARAEGRDTSELDREMSNAFRIAGELGASGNLMLREKADRWPHLRDAIHAAEARHVIDELEAARQGVDDAKRAMIDTDLVDKNLQTALRKGMDLALEGNHFVRDYAERDPELKQWIADGERDDASEALGEISHYRHTVRLAEDRNYASRFNDSLEGYYPGEGLDGDVEWRYLDTALERAARLAIAGNQIVQASAGCDRALRETVERMMAGQEAAHPPSERSSGENGHQQPGSAPAGDYARARAQESERRDEAGSGRGEGAQGVSRQSDRTEQVATSNDEYRADTSQQSRLGQIELELQVRQDREHDARER